MRQRPSAKYKFHIFIGIIGVIHYKKWYIRTIEKSYKSIIRNIEIRSKPVQQKHYKINVRCSEFNVFEYYYIFD